MSSKTPSFGEKLKELRKKRKETQAEVAAAIGCTIKSYREWEHDKLPRSDYLNALVKHFDVDMDFLTGRIENSTHDIDFISEHTGLSEEAIKFLHYLAESGNLEERRSLDLINRVLTDTASNLSNVNNWHFSLFALLDQYITSESVERVLDRTYDYDPDDPPEKWRTEQNYDEQLKKIAIAKSSAILHEHIDFPKMYREMKMTEIRKALDWYLEAENKSLEKKQKAIARFMKDYQEDENNEM